MKPPFRLVETRLPTDTIVALEDLLAQARMSKIVGIAFATIYKHREFTVNATGEARRSPTFTRGAVAALDDYLEKLVKKA